MLELIYSTLRNIGLGIFVNGAFAFQFADGGDKAVFAIIEGVLLMFSAGWAELKVRG